MIELTLDEQDQLRSYFKAAPTIYLPGISVDTVIFGLRDGILLVLVLKLDEHTFALPGGFIEKKEDLDEAAIRLLKERTGFESIFLEQFYTSGNTHRNQYTSSLLPFQRYLNDIPLDWFQQRFISICYYSLVEISRINRLPGSTTYMVYEWIDVTNLPALIYDHNLIVSKALSRLRNDIDSRLTKFEVLDPTFTMNQLQHLYETILQTNLQRANFQRKILSMDIVERLEKQYSGRAHKAPYLYRFKQY